MSQEEAIEHPRSVTLTEPEILPCIFSTGTLIDSQGSIIGLVFWAEITKRLSSDGPERRVQARLHLPLKAAQDLHRSLGELLRAMGRDLLQ